MDLTSNPLRVSGDGGLGFCYFSDLELFAGRGALEDGPLLIALDSNIIFDLEGYGTAIIDGHEIPGIDARLRAELDALGQILELWFLRDVRFIVVPRTRLDFHKQPSPERLASRERTFQRIESSLTFQAEDWGAEQLRFPPGSPTTPDADDMFRRVSPLDGLMLRSAWEAGVDVFMTRDKRILSAAGRAPEAFPVLLSPTALVARLVSMGSDPLTLGTVDHRGCRWAAGVPFGDSGKWGPLLEALSD